MAELQPKIKEMIGDTKFELEVSEFLLMPLQLNGVDGFTGKHNKNTRVLFAKVKKDENYTLLEQIVDTVIKGFLEDGVIKESDLDFQKLDPDTGM